MWQASGMSDLRITAASVHRVVVRSILSFGLAQRLQRFGCRVLCLLVEFVLGFFLWRVHHSLLRPCGMRFCFRLATVDYLPKVGKAGKWNLSSGSRRRTLPALLSVGTNFAMPVLAYPYASFIVLGHDVQPRLYRVPISPLYVALGATRHGRFLHGPRFGLHTSLECPR